MTDVGVWDFNPVGYPPGAVMYTGPQLFPSGIEPGTTKVGSVIYGPGGAVANFPAVQQGLPGLSPQFTFSQVQLAWNATLPSPNPQVTVTDPGTNGTRSKISVVFYVNAGEPGPAQQFLIGLAEDITGALTDGINLIYDAADKVFKPVPPKVGPIYSIFNIPPTALSSVAQRTLTSVNVPAQPWAWWPEVKGQAVVTDAVDTRVDLVAYLGTIANGVVVGRALGAGNGAGNVTQTLISAFGSDMPGSSQYGQVPAGQAAVVTFRAENQVSSSNQWATAGATFELKVAPVP